MEYQLVLLCGMAGRDRRVFCERLDVEVIGCPWVPMVLAYKVHRFRVDIWHH